jgi:hypothetical protein
MSDPVSDCIAVAVHRPRFGVVFDIDGVLLRGQSQIARAADALSLLQRPAPDSSSSGTPACSSSAVCGSSSPCSSSSASKCSSSWAHPVLFVSNASGYTVGGVLLQHGVGVVCRAAASWKPRLEKRWTCAHDWPACPLLVWRVLTSSRHPFVGGEEGASASRALWRGGA